MTTTKFSPMRTEKKQGGGGNDTHRSSTLPGVNVG